MTTVQIDGADVSIDAVLTVECGKALITKVGGLTILVQTTGGLPPIIVAPTPGTPVVTPAKLKLNPPDQGPGTVAYININTMEVRLNELGIERNPMYELGDPATRIGHGSLVELRGLGHLEFLGRQIGDHDLADLTSAGWE